jgi:protein-S-isoprenylcysteine O-methyltransferase Ste14
MSRLILKSILGFLFLVFSLGLALFLSAGSFAYWQAWVYLVVFSVCVILITLYLARYDQRLLASRVQAGPTAEVQKSQQIIQSLASLFFLGLFVVPGLDFRFHWSNVPPTLSLIADGLVALSLFFVFLVFRENTYTSAIIEVADEQKVISKGPYRLVRHPMYAGAFLLLLFTPIALGSWVGVPFALPVMLVIVFRLLDEERYLAANLNGYEEYRQKVRYRLIPFVW